MMLNFQLEALKLLL